MRTIARIFSLALSLAGLATPALAQTTCGAIPALPDTERRTEYSISASTGPLNVGFQIYGDATDYGNWIAVWVNGVLKTAITDYTVTSPSGTLGAICRPISDAQVTFVVAQTGTVEIVGARRPRRASQVSENRGVTAHDFNQIVTDMTATLRERWDREGRLLRSPPGETLSVLPPVSARANMALLFDTGGNPIAGTVPPAGTLTITTTLSTTAGMRLTLTSGAPVTESDVTGATHVYFSPNGNLNTIIYDGATQVPRQYTGELAYTLTAGNNPANKNFHLFEIFDSGLANAVVICSGPAWASDTAAPSGAGTAATDTTVGGRLTNSFSMTCINAATTYTVPAHQGNLIGGFRTTSIAGNTEDSALNRLLWSLLMPMPRPMMRVDTTDNWTYTTAAFRQANGAAANQLSWFVGVAGRPVNMRSTCWASSTNVAVVASGCGIGIDSTSVINLPQIHDDIGLSSTINQFGAPSKAEYNGFPTLGYHTGVWLEYGCTLCTFYGDNGASTKQSGITGLVYQ